MRLIHIQHHFGKLLFNAHQFSQIGFIAIHAENGFRHHDDAFKCFIFMIFLQQLRQILLPHSHHELDKVHWIEREKFHLTHRKRFPLMQFDTQKRTCSYDMIARRILCKIFERSNSMRGSLNLIQEYQRFALCAGYIRCSPNSCKNSRNTEILFK